MIPSSVVRVGLGAGVLLVALHLGGSICAAQSQAQAKANPPSESTSRTQNKGKHGLNSLKVATPSESSPAGSEAGNIYQIGVEDELQISVWHEPDLTVAVQVRPDGKITVPLLNDITVVGLKTEELQALLTEKLKAFVNEPQVTVMVRQIRSRKVSVFGQVVRQGTFALVGRKTILEVLGEAGGLGPFAKSGSIYILRTVNGQTVRIPFRYKQAIAGQGDNPVLLPGDVVVVP